MAQTVTDVGAAYILGKVFGASASLTLRLFTNNYTTVDASTNANYTVATGGGYADKTLAGAWTVADDGGGIQQASFAQQTWTFTGPLTTNPTIYGYAVLDGTTVIFAELLPAAFTPASNGDQLKITPVHKASKGTPT